MALSRRWPKKNVGEDENNQGDKECVEVIARSLVAVSALATWWMWHNGHRKILCFGIVFNLS